MNKERFEWIDICKGILIVTIVLTHIRYSFWQDNPFGSYLSNLTSLYKVSIFFCIAGLTLKEEKLKDTWSFIKSKIKNLWVKIVIVGLIAVLFHNILIKIGFYQLNENYMGKIMYSYGALDALKQSFFTLVMANREVIIGPMWYANVLFLALIILAIMDYFISIIIKNNERKRIIRLIAAFLLMFLSCLATNVIGFTIPRFNNTLTAVFLIDLCQFIYRELKWTFSNSYAFVLSCLFMLNLPLYGYLSMTNNYYLNPAYLIVVAISGMYFLYFVSRKISGGYRENTCFCG